MYRALLSFFLSGAFCSATFAQNTDREILPPPRTLEQILPLPTPIVEMGPLGPVRPGYFLPDPNAHWQFYAMDKQGFLKPRVILAPQGYQSFYLYNGKPYLFFPTRPEAISSNYGQR